METPEENLKDIIKEEKLFIKDATALVASKDDKKYYEDKKKTYRVAEASAETEEMRALMIYDLVRTRNELTFLLFRNGLLTKELEERFRNLPPIEEAIERYKAYTAVRNAEYEEENKKMQSLASQERRMEVFKAVLSGMSKEDAEARQKQYEDQMRASMGGK